MRRLRASFDPRVAAALVAVAAGLVLWLGGMAWFALTIPGLDSPVDPRPTDAIVVLTGGAQRLSAGMDLLHRGLARKLFVSGVYRGLEVAELLRIAKQSPAEADCCVALGHEAIDTVGNARESAAWMAQQHFRSLRLVTANYHMRRALLLFHAAMPDIEIVPNPVFPPGLSDPRWWRHPGADELVASEYDKYLAAALIFEVMGVRP